MYSRRKRKSPEEKWSKDTQFVSERVCLCFSRGAGRVTLSCFHCVCHFILFFCLFVYLSLDNCLFIFLLKFINKNIFKKYFKEIFIETPKAVLGFTILKLITYLLLPKLQMMRQKFHKNLLILHWVKPYKYI